MAEVYIQPSADFTEWFFPASLSCYGSLIPLIFCSSGTTGGKVGICCGREALAEIFISSAPKQSWYSIERILALRRILLALWKSFIISMAVLWTLNTRLLVEIRVLFQIFFPLDYAREHCALWKCHHDSYFIGTGAERIHTKKVLIQLKPNSGVVLFRITEVWQDLQLHKLYR